MKRTVELTVDQAGVVLSLMQAGVRAMAGDAFDAASVQYLDVRRLLVDAFKPEAGPAVPVATPAAS